MTIKGCGLALFLILSPLAAADTIVINFSGTMGSFFAPVGTPYSGQLVYTLPADQIDYDSYQVDGANDGLTISFGGSTFSSVASVGAGPPARGLAQVIIQSYDYGLAGNDAFTFHAYSPYSETGTLLGVTVSDMVFQVVGSPGFLVSAAMPTQINAASLLQSNNGLITTGITLDFNNGGFALGTIDSIQVTDLVPEPSSVGLTALALIASAIASHGVRRRISGARLQSRRSAIGCQEDVWPD